MICKKLEQYYLCEKAKQDNKMEISVENETERFNNFLNEEGNENIIFSGIFGIGKSYFLNHFFNEKKEEFIGIYLTPINYSVANNEDIFEYIKVDIMMQLLAKVPCDFEKQEILMSVAAYFYIKNNPTSFWGRILSTGEQIKFGTNIIDKIIALKKNIDEYAKLNSRDEESQVIDFLKSLSLDKGSIYEDDAITQIIRAIISSTKANDNPPKQVVLIIDDLDRIDPEHIFRILNILSVHNDFCGTKEQKFGFDKTILVCDIENIRSIYKYKYGIDVDFNGYIDKFYSKEIYNYNNIYNIVNKIPEILFTIKDETNTNIHDRTFLSHSACRDILTALIKSNSVNVRGLMKLIDKNIQINRIRRIGGSYSKIQDFPCMVIIDFIKRLFSSNLDAIQAISKINSSDVENSRSILRLFIALADYREFSQGAFSYNQFNYTAGKNIYIGMVDFEDSEITKIEISTVLRDAFNNYEKHFAD